MAEALQVLCVSPDSTIAAGVAVMLASLPDFAVASRTAGYRDVAADPRPTDIAIVVLEPDLAGGLAVIEALRRDPRGLYVVAVSADDDPETLVKTMRAGADELLALPLSQQDLLKVCVKVAEQRRGSPQGTRTNQVWVAYSPRGGAGVTTLIVNLAMVLRAAQRNVAVVDLDVYRGDVACFLNVVPSYTLRDVLANFDRLDSVCMQGMIVRHPSGLELLASPSAAGSDLPVEPSGAQTASILELVAGMHEVTLVDTPGILSEATRAALTAADRILLVTTLTVPAMRGCVRTLDWLRSEGVDPPGTVDVVVSKYGNRSGEISVAEASRTLKLPLRTLLPRDDAAALAAANSGSPLAEGTPLQRAIAALATGKQAPADTGGRGARFLRLFSAATR